MKTTAAVLVQTGQPLELAELEILSIEPGQVLVEIAYSGVCHTQLLEARGHRGEDRYLPHCLGHEGSGTVVDVGEGVSKCQPGDQVILSWMKGSGANVPGTVYAWNGKKVNAGGVTTFSRHAVVSENRVTVLPESFDLLHAALIGCAVPTGVGSVFNTANLQPGQTVAIFGTGGIGLCAISAAVIRGAAQVIAVDINAERLAAASAMGATETVNATELDAVERVLELCAGGVDFAIEASGRPNVMVQALRAVRGRGGTAVVIGNAHHGENIELDPGLLNQGKRLMGSWGGDNDPDSDFPLYCELISNARLSLAPLLSAPYPLANINLALDDLEDRKVARPLIDMKL